MHQPVDFSARLDHSGMPYPTCCKPHQPCPRRLAEIYQNWATLVIEQSVEDFVAALEQRQEGKAI